MEDNKNIESLAQQLHLLIEKENKSMECQHELQSKVTLLTEKLHTREEKIQKLLSKIKSLKDCFKNQTDVKEDSEYNTIDLLDVDENDLEALDSSVENVRKYSQDDISWRLENELEEKSREIDRLKHQLNKLEKKTKESMESTEALVQEVAGKHDTVIDLKQQVIDLEETAQQLTSKLRFKEDLLNEMRKEIKQLKTKTGSTPSRSPTKSNFNISGPSPKVAWNDNIVNEPAKQVETTRDNLQFVVLDEKSILMDELCILKEIKSDLQDDFHKTMENIKFNKHLADDHKVGNGIQAMIDGFLNRVSKNGDQGKLADNAFYCADKLREVIEILSNLCINKSKRIVELECSSQNLRDKNNSFSEISTIENKIPVNPEISRDQFNIMEEFRVCTVEAQAATEDIKEEVENVLNNFKCRNQLFTDLSNSIEKLRDILARSMQNISSVINSMKIHITEKRLGSDTIKFRQEKLKDMKNEINAARSKFNSSTGSQEHEANFYCKSFDNIMEEVEYIICNLTVFITKENDSLIFLEELKDHINTVEKSLENMRKDVNLVLQENEVAQVFVDDRTKKLDKLEQELEYTHEKMQDTLENIFTNQQRDFNSDYARNEEITTSAIEDGCSSSVIEINQLTDSSCIEDQLLEHKDGIQIQNDSVKITQEESEDSSYQRLQSKINMQETVIQQCMEENRKLVEQNRLQNQTIKHLQDAVVEAKKNLNRQLPQKFSIDYSMGDGWNKILPPVFNNGNVHDI